MSFSTSRWTTSPHRARLSFTHGPSTADASPWQTGRVVHYTDVDRSPGWDLSSWGPDRRRRFNATHDEEATSRKLQNLRYQFPTRSWRELEDALTEARGHAGKARKRLRRLSLEATTRASSPVPRAHCPVDSTLPQILKVEGLRQIGEKANGLYKLELNTMAASSVYLPSTIYQKTDDSGMSLFYDAGLWSIAASTSSEDALAFAESSITDPCRVPPEAWSVSNGAVWVDAPLHFRVFAVPSPHQSRHASPSPLVRVNELFQDLGDLEAGVVPHERLHSKIYLMRQRLEDVEDALAVTEFGAKLHIN